MDPGNTEAPMCEGAEATRVGVVFTTNPENTDCVVFDVEGRRVGYKSANDEDTRSFTFDQVVTADNMERLHCELLQPLPESISNGFNGALMICGASAEMPGAPAEQRIIRKVLTDLFSRTTSPEAPEVFISVSCLQFYPDGSAVDLLSLNKDASELITHPVLGSVVKGVCEVCVCSAEEASNVYETCRETMRANAGSVFSRCSSLFSVAVEQKLHPEQVESDVCRSRLQLFGLAGGASRTDLRGVNPLVKVLDHLLNRSAPDSDSLLLSLLKDALTGNYRTYLIYCINPRGLLNDEAPSALDLAQKARGLVTEAKSGRWNPKAAEREIREGVTDLQNKIMSQEGSEAPDIYRLAELSQNLQIVKDQSWEKRREESEKIKIQIKSNKSSNSNRQFSGGHLTEQSRSPETVNHLQDQLRREVEEHIREGKGSAEAVQERVERIQQLKDALREETLKGGAVRERSQLSQLFNDKPQFGNNEAQERRRQLKEDHARLIHEEVAKMEEDLAREQPPAEGPQRELQVLSGQRRVLVLQMEALRVEAQQAERDLQDQHQRHQTELLRLRDESLQVFRAFRQVSEEQRKLSEGRYRSVLLEAVQDAVYLSAQNQQLQADNKRLRKALGKIKDALAARGDPAADLITTQE